ncbi:TRAP transporter substrate-binding protein [Celeribacter sp. ULVN23_4]
MKILTLVTVACTTLGAVAAEAETLKVSTFLPPNHVWNRAITAWGEELSELSGGELELEIFPAGQLGPPSRQYDLVRSGATDFAVILHSATPGRFPMTELAGLPLTSPSEGSISAISSRRLTELAPEYLAAEHPDTKIMWMAVTPPLKIHLAKADPSVLSVFKGKRIRYAGETWQKIIETLGGSPVPVPPAEAADSMSKGVVDGACFPFEATKSFDLAPVTSYSMEPGLAAAPFAFVMSQASYDSLSPDLQAIIDETTGPDRAAWFGEMMDEGEAEGRQYLVESGVEIIGLSQEQIAELKADFTPIVVDAVATVLGAGDAEGFLKAYTE